MMRFQLWAITIAAALSGAGVAAAQAPIDSNIAVTPYAQTRGIAPCGSRGDTGCGGCYPDGLPPSNAIQAALAQLPKVNPEWQAIGPMIQGPGGDPSLAPNAALTRITGSIRLSKSPGDDFPGSHMSPDYNAEIDPDDTDRLATGNGPGGTVEFEWEGDLFPMFAWPGEGDRTVVEGRWIFDCGHPDPGPLGKCSNDGSKTCIIDTDCAIVTSIDIDHTEYLGDTREKIAFEKAGIFRPGKPAVCGDPVPPQTLVEHARKIGADLWLFGRDFRYEGQAGSERQQVPSRIRAGGCSKPSSERKRS